MRLIWSFLAVAAVFGLGFHAGRDAEKREAKKQADAMHRLILGTLALGIKSGLRVNEQKRQTPVPKVAEKPKTDTVANEPLRFKPGDADRALRDGNLALLKDYEGQDN